MPGIVFERDNAEELISLTRLGLSGLDHLLGYVPSHDALSSAELAALLRLLSASLNLGLEAQQGSNGPLGPSAP